MMYAISTKYMLFLEKLKSIIQNKDTLTLWMNNLLVLYAFFLPIAQSIKAKIFIAILILFFIRGDVKYYLKEAWKNQVVRAFVYLFVIYVLGLLWSENIKEGLRWVKSIKYGLYLIVFYSFVDGRYIKRVLAAFISGMLLSEIISYGMILHILPWKFSLLGVTIYEAPTPVDPSPFLNHIHYGVALSLVVILLAQQIYLSHKPLIVKIFMSIFIFTASANIFVTGGRTGYVTFILLLLILAIFYLRKWAIIGLTFVILVVGIALETSPILQQKVQQTTLSAKQLLSKDPNFNTSMGIRAGMYYYGMKAIGNNLVFGVGTGDSMDVIRDTAPKEWEGRKQPHEHNQYFSTFMKLGFVGLLVFLNIFYQIFRYKQEDKELRFIMVFTTLTVAFGILTTQFNLRFFMPLWVVMLSITLIQKNRQTILRNLNDKQIMLQIIGAGMFFFILYIFLKGSH
ncbi:O-antigen ligase family protein [Sulfurimonas paralvinellae]|uniref:O-antigen ligase family protein n=1 Tax=Sulfurimonas paralvinellae TaxID=317658 RepID=A0A7M1B8R0_9BACT|nr:O-antigen ligase family protein [Sulfurimonas paralvinellae]QOP46109.1 O-antigen ligase family protein [Sulfurimonas paralvinellae]